MEIIVEKKCCACHVLRPLGDFRMIRANAKARRHQDYPSNVCKACELQRSLVRKRAARHAALKRSERKCECCGVLRPMDEFRPVRALPDGTQVRAKSCQSCETKAGKRHAAKAEVDDLVPAYYPDPLHRVARDWRGPVTGTPSPSVGLVCNPWRMAA